MERLTNKNILVTGNEGYIGSVLVEHLIEKGYHVTGLDSGIFKDARFTPRKSTVQKQIYKDIRDVEPADFAGIDAVIHLAGLSNDPLGNLNPALTYAINLDASVNIARLAKETGVKRFLFSSSCSMYGVSSKELVNEESALDPQTAYAESKVKAEEGITKLASDSFSPIFLRNATVFGTSPRMRLDLVAQNLLALGYVKNMISILSDGTPWRPLLHIQDAARAFCFFLEAPIKKIHNQAFNVGHQENNVQIKTIAQRVGQVIPTANIEIKNENPSDNRSYKVDFSKLYSLGFTPQHTLADGINEMHETFQKINFTEKDFGSPFYHTLARYQTMVQDGTMDPNLRVLA